MDFEFKVRPHPGPPHEPERRAPSRPVSIQSQHRAETVLGAPPVQGFNVRIDSAKSLLGGEGRGEGERGTVFSTTRRPRTESGSLLIIVLWIAFGLVAITLYFAHAMNQELRAADNRVAAIAANQAIEGAARYLSNFLATVAYPGVMPQPAEFACAAVPVGEAKFWLVGRDTNDWEINLTAPAFGLVDEAAKLNLNAPWLTAEMIEYLPGMTPQIAAAIMDWRDTNSDLTADGAEDETYSQLTPAYRAKNAAFESVEELRLVKGMTAEILYGEDANLNGILDANENDADESAPYDNRDGRLDPGLMEYFTVYSYEPMNGTNITVRGEMQGLLESIFGTSQRTSEIMSDVFGTPQNPRPAVRSALELFVRGVFTDDEAAQVAGYLAPTTNNPVNVNTASQAVLECIPGIGVDYAATLVAYRESNPSKLTSVKWVAEAIGNDDAIIGTAGPFLTTRSFQYTADIAAVGHHNRGYQRVRYVFDTSEEAPKVIRRQDLTHLGWALGRETRTELLAAAKETR
jgi:DNA uptake protein ComE-like DNA-binding protein